uniref:SHSP domain-containing protein n=2 Tax=Meloidogyne TaxID=189290 RepID=A0A914LAR0_MELIC
MSESERTRPRPSPRWREPLVDEYINVGDQTTSSETRDFETRAKTTTINGEENKTFPENVSGKYNYNGLEKQQKEKEEEERSWERKSWTKQERTTTRGDGLEEERPFFSEEFYQAFPHLRPKTTSISTNQIRPFFSSYLDRFDRDWRSDPFWRDLYPRWAEPVFKEGIDVKTNVTNDSQRFSVEIDCYQFRPEELQVKTLDDTLLIEGRHEDVRDRDNYTKMYFVRKYQLPSDVEPQSIASHVDSHGRLTVEAQKRWQAIEGRERAIPIESQSTTAARRFGANSRSSSYSPRDQFYDSGRGTQASDYYRGDSRAGGGDYLLSPSRNGGYKSEYEQRQTDANGMRHEARREEFREEFRRTGSAANALSPPTSIYRPPSRLSAVDSVGGGGGAGSHRSESHFRRTASASRNEYRGGYNGADHLLRPAEELGGRSSVFGRSVPIQRA